MNKPFDFSRYERTYNNAIDIVAQAVGWARLNNKPIACVRLKPSYYDLFKCGVEVLMKKELVGYEELEFDGVKIARGNALQFDTVKLEYYVMSNVDAQA